MRLHRNLACAVLGALFVLQVVHAPGLVLAADNQIAAAIAEPALPPAWASAIRWRSIGPANMSGRIGALAVYEADPMTYWVGTASGGLLKTTNAGTTYEHQFDRETTVSIGDVAVAASDPSIVWVGTGEKRPRNSVSYGDGVYKSTDGGKTWTNMGLRDSFQIGKVIIHPTDPNIVYVGALGRLYGPNEERGLYKTTDGGKSWERILYVDDKTGVVDVDMHPTDPQTLWAATYERERDLYDTNDPSKKWGPGGGIWKTTDGGKTWKRLTQGLPTVQIGRVGVDVYRKNPDVLYAVVESERITQLPPDTAFMGMSGENAEVGARLTSITANGPSDKAGLKTGDIIIAMNDERIGSYADLTRAIRQQRAGDTVTFEYVRDRQFGKAEVTFTKREGALTEQAFSGGLGGQRENVQDDQGRDGHEMGGIYRSEDGGETWKRINSLNPRPMYYSELRVDPSDDNYVYVLGTSLYRSRDGGKTFTGDGARGGVHVDHHALWINPKDGRHMILGNDGGVYVTHDRMENWDHHNHVAIGQFYHVAVDPTPFYNVYGGLQDNGSWGGPNRTRTSTGPVNTDWISIGGGDGFVCRVDPNDPKQIYFESQNGGMGRIHLGTGERGFIRPRAQRGQTYRFNWNTPYMLSSHNSRIYYVAGNYVFKSLDRGDNLRVISPEITRTQQGSATAFGESPRDPDVLYVGTDCGALWMTRDGGVTWTDLFSGETKATSGQAATPAAPAGTGAAPPATGTGGGAAGTPGSREAAMLRQMIGRMDANNDGKLQRDEVPQQMRALFDRVDANKDGVIDDSELAALAGGGDQPAAPASGDPVTGTWKSRLVGAGIPAEASEFTLTLTLAADNSVKGRFESPTMKGDSTEGTFDRSSGALTMTFNLDRGAVKLTGAIRNGVISGSMDVASGLLQIRFEGRKEGGAEAPAASTASRGGGGRTGSGAATAPPATTPPPAAPPTPPTPPPAPPADPVSGTWDAELVSDQIPPGAGAFTMKLKLESGNRVTGTVSSSQGDGTIREGSFDAARGMVRAVIATGDADIVLTGTIKDGAMTGDVSIGDGAFTAGFKARKSGEPALLLQPISSEPLSLAFDDVVSGEWTGRFVSDDMPPDAGAFTMKLALGEGGKVTGTYTSRFGDNAIESGSFNAETGDLKIAFSTGRGEGTIEGKIADGKFTGTLTAGGGQFTVPVEAARTAPAAPSTPPAAAAPAAPAPRPAPAAQPAPPDGPASIDKLLPKRMCVSAIEPSRYVDGRVYVTFDGHRSDNDEAWVFVSEDYGRTWKPIRQGLPRGSTRVIREDIQNPDVLYLGTEFSAFASVDRGATWTRINNNLPTVAVHEFAQHPTSGEIVAGTHGRSLWIADVTPIRQMTQEARAAAAHLYRPTTAIMWRSEPARGASGTRRFIGENPPTGVPIYYSLTRRPQSISLTIEELDGRVLRELSAATEPGLYRVLWDFRRAPQQPQGGPGGAGGGAGRGGGGGGGGGAGAALPPGRYRVVLTVDGNRLTQELNVVGDPDYPDVFRAIRSQEQFEEAWNAFRRELRGEGEFAEQREVIHH